MAGITSASTYITSEAQIGPGYFVFPLFIILPLYQNLIRSWKEEQQWIITLLPGLIRYNGPRKPHKTFDAYQFIGKVLGENGKEEYQRDIKLAEITKIEAIYSKSQLIAIDYTTDAGYDHRIVCYENMNLILQHLLNGAGSKCKFERYNRKVTYIWP